MRPIAIVQHDPYDGPSYFATWLRLHGLDFEVFQMFEASKLPDDLSRYSGICLLGGPMSANDPLPYYAHLFKLVREAIRVRTPVIGHCLGGQLLSRAMGGTVQSSEHTEIGWSTLEPMQEAATEWFGEGPLQLFQWHGESFSIPEGATQLLRGRYCATQAYVVDNIHLGMQFHCEVDLPKLHCWLDIGAEEIARSASPGVQTTEAMRATLEADTAHSQRIADHIYTRWAKGLQD